MGTNSKENVGLCYRLNLDVLTISYSLHVSISKEKSGLVGNCNHFRPIYPPSKISGFVCLQLAGFIVRPNRSSLNVSRGFHHTGFSHSYRSCLRYRPFDPHWRPCSPTHHWHTPICSAPWCCRTTLSGKELEPWGHPTWSPGMFRYKLIYTITVVILLIWIDTIWLFPEARVPHVTQWCGWDMWRKLTWRDQWTASKVPKTDKTQVRYWWARVPWPVKTHPESHEKWDFLNHSVWIQDWRHRERGELSHMSVPPIHPT